MKLGLGIYARMLTRDNLRFARQLGAEAIVVHMADYSTGGETHSHFDADAAGRDVSSARGKLWTLDELASLRRFVESEDLELAALENLNPALWHDVLLGGPLAAKQRADICEIIRRIGQAGIPCLGYNFSLAGVCGRTEGAHARAGALSMAYSQADADAAGDLPGGWVGNRIYDRNLLDMDVETQTHEVLESRLREFHDAALPVAEESGVKIAIHPDDPPVRTLRGTPRIVCTPDDFRRHLDARPSPANVLEFCVGTVAEMPDVDVYETVDEFSAKRAIGYLHFRNVRGKLPEYSETFVDDGDIDMLRVLRILHRNEYEGVLIPDHTPFPNCAAPWHAGMAFALGFMRGAIRSLGSAA